MGLYEDRARSIDAEQKKLLSSRRGQQQLQAMMHDVELTEEQLAYMCHAHEVNMLEVFDNGEDWQAHYGDVRGSIPMERFRRGRPAHIPTLFNLLSWKIRMVWRKGS